MKKIYLFGGGGHSLSCIDVIEKEKKFKIFGIFDEKLSLNKKISGYRVINERKKIYGSKFALVCVGQIKSPKLRIKIFEKMKKKGFLPATVISPLSTINKNVKIGEGTIIMNGSIINSKVKIGKNCIINTGCIIEHEAKIEDHCHISTGVILNGGVKVKKGSFIGSGAILSSAGTIDLTGVEISNSIGNGIMAESDITLNVSGVLNSTQNGVICKDVGDIAMTGSYAKGSGAYGVYASNGDVSLSNSYVTHGGAQGVRTNRVLALDHAVIAYNANEGVELSGNYFSTINNSIVWHNDDENYEQIETTGGILNITYSNVQGLGSFGIESGGELVIGAGCIESNPVFTDSSGTLSENSPCVDAASPYANDANMPPGLGYIDADMGAYGGEGNVVWGGSALPDGDPDIDQIVDLPDDQGGSVGIQYSGSAFDHSHSAYDVTSYSFWRELDVENSSPPDQADTDPTKSYFLTDRDNYWEQVGTMDAQGFEDYGYSAPTLADSSSDGIFWSKYLVVAHTPDDEIYFVSDPDSGYSVDNIAPTAPSAFSVAFDEGILTASWEDEINPDILHYDVYRDGSSFLETSETQFTDDGFDLGDSEVFTVRGVDVNDNMGEFSDPFTVTYGTKGDMTWDGIINILDVTKIIYHILFPEEDITDEEYWAGNFNDDEGIDVVDVTPVVDIILGGLLSEMENSGGQTMAFLNDNNLILNSDRPITGVQIRFSDNTVVSNLTNLNMASQEGRVVLYTTTGEVLQGENIPLLSLNSDAIIEDLILVDNLGERISTVLKVIEGDLVPDEFAVHQNYPNPFNPATLIKVDVNEPMNVMVSIYDVMGREVNVLVNEELYPGYHQFIWDGTDNRGMKAGSGLYFIMVQTPEITRTMKATLLR